MRGAGLLLLAVAVAAADGSPTQAEQDEIWRKAMEESRQVKTRVLPAHNSAPNPPAAVSLVPHPQPTDPAVVKQQEPAESECGAGTLWFLAIAVIGCLVIAKRIPAARTSGPGLYCGWWTDSTVLTARPLRTPLGGRVTILRLRVDITYTMTGTEVQVQKVDLSRGSGQDCNVVADRTGEAFTATHVDADSLMAAVSTDLADPKCALRRELVRSWQRHHPDATPPPDPGRTPAPSSGTHQV